MGIFDTVKHLFTRSAAVAPMPTPPVNMVEGLATTPAVNFSLRALLILQEKPGDIPQQQWKNSIETQLGVINKYVADSKAEKAFMHPPCGRKKIGYVLVTMTAMGLMGLSADQFYIYHSSSVQKFDMQKEAAKENYRNARYDYPDIFSFANDTNKTCTILPYQSVCTLVPCRYYDDYFEACQRQLFNSGDNCSKSIAIRMTDHPSSNYSLYEENCSSGPLGIIILSLLSTSASIALIILIPMFASDRYKKSIVAEIMDRPIDMLYGNMLLAEDLFEEDKRDREEKPITIGYAKTTLKHMFAIAKKAQSQSSSNKAHEEKRLEIKTDSGNGDEFASAPTYTLVAQ
jgi:hypothetical protein